MPGEGPVPLEMWFSFRSPYSYLALERITEIAARHQVTLALRPILPMVDRGIPAPAIKRMYIVRDAKREADRLGIPFGQIADPLGTGVEHCIAIMKLAIDRGLGVELARSAMRGIWSEALDVASYVDLRTVVERAGLGWDEARAALADDGWKAWAKLAADDLLAIGLWGVPAFRAGDYNTWGQDRLDFLEDRLRRHEAAPPVPVPAVATE
jgi:2-hydroxychromene-2-carboxylate isomerase